MYMNNRAAEALTRGRLDDAYWWSREANVQDPAFVRAYNTLGVVYRRHGDLAEAERVLRPRDGAGPDEPAGAVANLAQVLSDQGRAAEAGELKQRLAPLESDPPFAFFHRGQEALPRATTPRRATCSRARWRARRTTTSSTTGSAVAYAELGDVIRFASTSPWRWKTAPREAITTFTPPSWIGSGQFRYVSAQAPGEKVGLPQNGGPLPAPR